MAMTTTTAPLPLPIRSALARIDRRLKVARTLRGLGGLAILATAAAAAGMAADFFWPLPNWLRFGLWGTWILAVLGPSLALCKSLARHAEPEALAALAERASPPLGERITGLVGLRGPDARGAPGLIAAAASDAAAHAGAVDPAAAVPLKPARRWAVSGMLGVLALAAPALCKPDPFALLAGRFLMPWRAFDRVGPFSVSVWPGDAVVGIGTDLNVQAKVVPRFGRLRPPDSAWLEWTEENSGILRRLAMGKVDDGGFRATLPGVAGPLWYRVVAGGSGEGESRRYSVLAVEPPAVVGLDLKIIAPDYMNLPPVVASDPRRVEAREGSRVRLEVTPSRPVRSVSVEWPVESGGPRLVEAEVSANGLTASVTLPAEVSGAFSVGLLDRDGIASRPETPSRLSVLADAPPVVTVSGNEGVERTRPDDTLRVGVQATDDLAVASAELHYTVEREGGVSETGQATVKLSGVGTPFANGPAVLPLGALGLKPGDALSYRVKVTDNRPPPKGPNISWSGSSRLSVAAEAPPMASRRGQAEREAIQAELDDLKKAAAENRHEAELLRYAADAVARGNGAWDRDRSRALTAREAAGRALADRLRALSRTLAESPAFGPLAEPARQAADLEAEAARDSLDRASKTDEASQRLTELRQADARLGAVSARLDDLQRGLDALARGEADRQKLQDLADRQAGLAEAAEKPLDQLDAGQNAVKQELDALLRDNPAMKAAMLDAQADRAEALAQRARELAELQRVEAREATDLAPRAGLLRKLAEAQRALTEDARRLALDVDLPLVQNGRPKIDLEAPRKAIEPIGRGDLVTARNRLVEAENLLRRHARDLGETPGDLKALARRLTARQDRLTRDLDEAMGESRSLTILPDAERAAMAEALKPLAHRQRQSADLAAAIVATTDAKAAVTAAEVTSKASRAIASAENPREAGKLAVEARNALNALANTLPDPWKREEPTRRAFAEAKQWLTQAVQQVDRHRAETDRLLASDPARASSELADRLANAGDLAEKAAERLIEAPLDTAPRLDPHRRRAEGRARELVSAIKELRSPPGADGFNPSQALALREAVSEKALAARVGFDRLEQKLNGQGPADDLAAELAAEQAAMASTDPVSRRESQRGLATALRLLPAPDAPKEQAEAVRLATLAANNPEDPEASRLATAAVQTLAARLSAPFPAPRAALPTPPDDPDLAIAPEHEPRALELARRERRIREQLMSLLSERVAPQRDLRGKSSRIGAELADLRDRAKGLSPKAAGPASAAASLLGEQAPRAMDEAADRLGSGQPDPARAAQRRAAELAERGAQQAEDLAKALRDDRPPDDLLNAESDANADAKHRQANPLADAREAVEEAARKLARARKPDLGKGQGQGEGEGEGEGQGPPSEAMDQARTAMKGAAEKLQDAADRQATGKGQGQGKGKGQGQGKEPGGPAGAVAQGKAEPRGQRAGVAAPTSLGALQEMVRARTGKVWGELPGHLRDEILQMSQGRYRDDYARLIQLYYREIAGAADEEPRP